MQLIDYRDDETVRFYHTIPSKAGTPGFECGGRISLANLPLDRLGYYEASCPVDGCKATMKLPLRGDPDARKLHAHARLADPTHPATTLDAAITSVIADVEKIT